MLVMVKPDAVMDKRDQEIKNFLINSGMSIVKEKNVWLSPAMLKVLYNCHIDDSSFKKMTDLYACSFAIVILFEGECAVSVGQKAKRIFREKYNYGYYGSTIHVADSAEESIKEAFLLMGKQRG